MAEMLTPSQTVGPFFSIGMMQLCRAEIVGDGGGTERISVRGRLLAGDGEGVPDAVLEIWLPATAGATERSLGGSDAYPKGFARVATNDRGDFEFVGPRPVAAKALDAGVHAPHFAVLVFMRGLLRHLVTRLYLPDEPANAEDVTLRIVPVGRRATLIAMREGEKSGHFRWDIRLQGEHETVFFEA